MKTAIVSLSMMLASIVLCFAGDIHLSDSCRRPYPDSNLIRSCQIHYDSCSSSGDYSDASYWYAKECYHILIKQAGAFNFIKYRMDTTIVVSWQEIDTADTALRNGFEQLEDRVGIFSMIKQIPEDSNDYRFSLVFDQYCLIDSVKQLLSEIPDVEILGMPFLDLLFSVNEPIKFTTLTGNIYPLPAEDKITIPGIFATNNLEQNVIVYSSFAKTYSIPLTVFDDRIELDIRSLQTGTYSIVIAQHILPFIIVR